MPSCSFNCCFLLLEITIIKPDHSWFCRKFCWLSQLQCSCSARSLFEHEYQPLKVWLKDDSRIIYAEALSHPNHLFLCSQPLSERFHKLSCCCTCRDSMWFANTLSHEIPCLPFPSKYECMRKLHRIQKSFPGTDLLISPASFEIIVS